MSQSADVIVVGGGIIGASAAYHLASMGVKNVMVLEKQFIGAGATGRSGALVRMHYTNVHEARLALTSLRFFQTWTDTVGGVSPLDPCGVVRIVSPMNADRLRANVQMLRSIGVATHIVEADELKLIAPPCAVEDVGLAAYEPESGYADPIVAVFGLVTRATQLGARFREGVRVDRVCIAHGRVTGVDTNEGYIQSERVLLAVGPWSSPHLRDLGIQLGLVPTRIQLGVFRVPPSLEGHRLVYVDGPLDQWIRPFPGNCMLAGSGAYRFERGVDPDAYDESLNPDYSARCRDTVTQRIPAMSSAPMRGGWAGVVASSPDAKPVYGAAPAADGLVFAAGDSGTSFKTAPAVGLGLAEWVMHGAPRTVDLHPFRYSRFAEGEPIIGPNEYVEDANERLVLRQ